MRRLVHALGLSLALLAAAAPGQAAPDGLDDQARGLFAWWDGLGYPDVARLPFVRVFEGAWREDDVGARHAAPTHAFLLAEEGAAFRVFATDLTVARYATDPAAAAPHRRVGVERTDLVEFARAGMTAMRAVPGPVAWHDEKTLDPFELHRWADPNQAWRLIVLARAVAARDEPALAMDLLDLARREASDVASVATWARLRGALLREARVQLVAGLANPEATLAELSATAQRLLEGSSADGRPAELADDAAILAAMLAEERSPTQPPPTEPGTLTPQEVVRRLREERGVRWASYGGSSLPPDQPPDAPQRLLAARGREAVPALLAALDERSFTRSVRAWDTGHGQRRWHLEPYRVGDAALDVLREIAAGAFDPGWDEFHRLQSQKAEDRAFAREAADAWWREVQTQGEVALLAARVSRADDLAAWPAQRLAQVAPHAARPVLVAAIRAAERPFPQAALVEPLASIPGPEVTEDLLALLDGPGPPRLKLALAKVLTARGRREGLACMLTEWRAPAPPERAPESPEDLDLPLDPFVRSELLSYLLEVGDLEVLETLAGDLPGLDVTTRFQIVTHFLRPPAGEGRMGSAPPPPPLSDEARRALEDLLGASLADEGEAGGTYLTVGDVEVGPHVGQAAALALAQHFPDVYRFDPRLPRRGREEQRRAAENVWRQRRGLAPKPPPPRRPRPAPVPDEVVGPALDRLLAATEDSQRELAERRLETLGLGALPAVTARLERTEADDADRAPLSRVAARLASIVTAVRLEPEALVSKGWREQAEALEGQAFSGRSFAALVLHATRSGAPQVEGLHLGVERHDDGTGVEVTIRLLPGVEGAGPADRWETSGPSLWVGARRPGGSGGQMAHDYGRSEAAWEDDAAEVDAAFGAAPEHGVRLGFRIQAVR